MTIDPTSMHAASPRWSARTSAIFALFVVAAFVSLFWLVHPYFEAINDAAIYMLCAKSLLAGEGYSYLGQPFIIRPPGFSLLIAPVVWARGFDFAALNWYVSLWGVAGVALLFVYARNWIGTACALAVAVCVWLNPGYRSLCNQVMSDVPGIALLALCLIVERWARAQPSVRRDALLGALIALGAYVRTVTVLLVPAIVLVRLYEHVRRAEPGERLPFAAFVRTRLLAIVLVPVLLLAPWSVRNGFRHPPTPVDQTSLFSYSTGMWNVDRGDPASPRLPLSAVAQRVPVRFQEAFSVLGSRLASMSERANETDAGSSRAADVAIGVVLFALGVLGFLRRRDPCAPFLGAVVAIVLVYFSFQDRLMLPVYVLCLPAAADLALWLLASRMPNRAAHAIVAGALLALALVDFRPRARWTELEQKHRAFSELCEAVGPRIPPDAVLAAPMRGWYFSVFLERPVYSLYFAWDRARDMRAVEELIDRHRIDTLLLSPWTDFTPKPMLPYFQARYPRLERVGQGAIARVRD